ncbi:MAG: hypothetical protein M3336_07965 [Chloroflexota bacterium]|nr:hypothetical protein [Chloroflexota bacterium]
MTRRLELLLAGLVTVLGIGATTYAALVHAAPLVAPGALLVTVGGAWLGNTLARANVRLLPGPPPLEAGEGKTG